MTHVVPCSKSISVARTATLYWRHVAELHGVVNVSTGSLTVTSGGKFRGCAWPVGIIVYYTLLYIIVGNLGGLCLIVV